MNIAFIIPSLANKGPVVVVRDLISQISDFCSIHVYYFDEILELHIGAPSFKVNFFQEIPFNNYQVIHSHGLRPDAYLFFHKKKIKGCCISTLHNYMYEDLKYVYHPIIAFFASKFWQLLLTKHNNIVTLSKHMKEYYQSQILLKRREFAYIYNGRDISTERAFRIELREDRLIRSLKEKYHILGVAAQLSKRKGLDQVIKALKKLAKISLIVVGDGPQKKSLQNLADKLGVSGRCLFLGNKENALPYFRFFDAYVMSSISEGFPLAMIEASAHGLPIICSELPIFKEIFKENEVAFFQIGNISSLEDSIVTALENKSSFSEKILKKYESDFTAKKMADSYLKLYKTLS